MERSEIRVFSLCVGIPGLRYAPSGLRIGLYDYFSDVLTAVNLVESVGPMLWTLTMIASAMPQAIRQYSIAVAPLSSRRNFAISRTQASRSPANRFFRADAVPN
jgi:hypothetical protein